MLSVALGVVPIKEADAAGRKNSNGQNSSGGNTCTSVNQNVGNECSDSGTCTATGTINFGLPVIRPIPANLLNIEQKSLLQKLYLL
jgi:hypothetical protein